MDNKNDMKPKSINKEASQKLAGSEIQPDVFTVQKQNETPAQQLERTKSIMKPGTKDNIQARTNFKKYNNQEPKLGAVGMDEGISFPGAKHDKIVMNPALDRTEQINKKLAERKKIMDQGFAPKGYEPFEYDEDDEEPWKDRVLKKPELLDFDVVSMMESDPDKYDYDEAEGKDWNKHQLRKGNLHNDLFIKLTQEDGFTPEEANHVLDAWLGTVDEDRQAWEAAGWPMNSSAEGAEDIPNVDEEEAERAKASELYGIDLSNKNQNEYRPGESELRKMGDLTDKKYGISLRNAVKDLKKYDQDSLLGGERAISQLMDRFGLSKRDIIRYLNYAFDGTITEE